MAEILKEYFTTIRPLIILGIFFLAFLPILAKDIYSFYREKKAESRTVETKKKLEKAHNQLENIEKKQKKNSQKLDLLLRDNVIATGDWKTVDVSKAVPPVVSDAVLLIFQSKGGIVRGYVKGFGFDEPNIFDTSLNDKTPVAVKLKETKIQYMILFPKDRRLPLDIFVAGYKLNIR